MKSRRRSRSDKDRSFLLPSLVDWKDERSTGWTGSNWLLKGQNCNFHVDNPLESQYPCVLTNQWDYESEYRHQPHPLFKKWNVGRRTEVDGSLLSDD